MDYNLNKFDLTRSYTSRRLDPINDIRVAKEINNYFDSADEYLDVKDNIIVGKLVKGPRYDNNRKPLPFSFVGNKQLFEYKAFNRRITNSIIDNLIPKETARQPARRRTTGKGNDHLNNIYIYDDLKIKNIFDDAKKRIEKNKTNPEISGKFLLTREKFMKQEKILDTLEDEKMRTTTFSKFMADRTHRTEENLLFNKTDAFRKKRNVLEIIENEKNLFDKFGNNNWLVDVRRPTNLSRVRTAYVNICPHRNKNRFQTILDFPKKDVEIILSPDSKDNKDIKIKSYINSKNVTNSIKRIKNMANLSIEGKSVLEEEMKRAKVIPGRKIIFKEPEKEAVEEIYKEDYDDKIYLHEKTFGLR
jgi:hypothetical protein